MYHSPHLWILVLKPLLCLLTGSFVWGLCFSFCCSRHLSRELSLSILCISNFIILHVCLKLSYDLVLGLDFFFCGLTLPHTSFILRAL
ncbi:hypothetical protein B0H11DRAFT_2045812 [Mycena galericulata]|nr:hypothetical protein B0H11DRAFT_2102037 [Mycena galericulata]KAJ7468432.1 hypothetical protein B0H11DRAFT_2045812 [Mycena galericulata]